MEKVNITFISSRGRGMDEELILIKKELEKTFSDVSFRYFIKQEISNNKAYVSGLKAAKKRICQGTDHIVCMDMSQNLTPEQLPEGIKKVLVQIPFNYVFEAMLRKQLNPDASLKIGAVKFTHVYSTSPFGTELLKKAYDITGVEIIEGYCSPYAYQLAQEEYAKEQREILTRFYPQSKGKKILAILNKSAKLGKDNWLREEKVDMESFIRGLGEEWFVVTDCKEIVNLLKKADVSLLKSFGYIHNVMYPHHALAFTDLLLTNYGPYIELQASRRKPSYVINYNNNDLEKYYMENYPELVIDQMDKLMNVATHAKMNEELHQKISDYFSYPPTKPVTDHLCPLLKGE